MNHKPSKTCVKLDDKETTLLYYAIYLHAQSQRFEPSITKATITTMRRCGIPDTDENIERFRKMCVIAYTIGMIRGHKTINDHDIRSAMKLADVLETLK
jgi:hypothetical protein